MSSSRHVPRVSGAGSLQGVLVYLSAGVENPPPREPGFTSVVEIRGCRYETRLVAIRREQSVTFDYTEARTLHNPHAPIVSSFAVAKSFTWPRIVLHFPRSRIEPVQCDVHEWMVMHVGVLDHPYFDVTDAAGVFRLPSVPAGEYTMATWHETLGELTRNVWVEPRQHTVVNFVYGTDLE